MILGSSRIVSFCIAYCISILAFAQQGSGRIPFTWQNQSAFPVPVIKVASPNIDSLMLADERETALGLPYRFGFAVPQSVDFFERSNSYSLPTGERISLLEFSSPGALSLNLNFSEFYLADGVSFWVYNDKKFLGAFTSASQNRHGNFATIPLEGNHVVLELHQPSYVTASSRIVIQDVVFGYREDNWNKDGFGTSGNCNVNINCPQAGGFEDQRQAVVMLLTSNNTRKCSGTMINNTANDGTPYLLTARHCATLTNAVFMFNYQSPDCSVTDGPTSMVVQGCDIVAENPYSDFSLLRLDHSPPPQFNAYFIGWSRDTVPSPMGFCIHHPRGDIKKFSVDSEAVDPATYLGPPTPGANHWRVGDWNIGTTEGGSSGSCLLDSSKLLRGQLHGGFASCANNSADYFGRFDRSWNYGADSSLRLMEWLDPAGLDPISFNGGYYFSPFYNRDLALVRFLRPGSSICTDSVNPILQITSWGSDTVSNFSLAYSINGTWDTLEWNGMMVFNDTIELQLPALATLTEQNYVLSAHVYEVNGLPDEYVVNDTSSVSFDKLSGYSFTIEWKTDNAPAEGSWTFLDENGNTVAGGSYSEADSLFTDQVCVPAGCYTFKATDSGGNGLCCTNGQGYFKLSDPNGNLIAFRGTFGASESVYFCYPVMPGSNDLFHIYPVPNDGNFNLIVDPQVIGENLQLRISDMNGRIIGNQQFTASYFNSFSFPGLADGVYNATIYSAYKKQEQTRKILICR